MRRCVWSRNLMNEEVMARVGPQRHRKKNVSGKIVIDFSVGYGASVIYSEDIQVHTYHIVRRQNPKNHNIYLHFHQHLRLPTFNL